MDLEDAMLELRSGDINALSDIYQQTKPAVYATVLSVLHDRYAAEDAVQDVYVRLAEKIGRYKPDGRAKAWICRLARNVALNILRHERPHADIDECRDLAAKSDGGVRDIIDDAAEVLSADELDAVLLYAVGGLSHSEIAELYKIPYATVRWRYRNALEKLRAHFGKEESRI